MKPVSPPVTAPPVAALPETPTEAALRRRCQREGPVPLAAVMAAAVADYYAQGTAFGVDGDFITAPEISQIFGELLGLWSAVVWQSMGQPSVLNWVEVGPGRGTLIADALRATAKVAGFHAAVRLHLVETSPALRQQQQAALRRSVWGERPCQWHDSLETVADGPMILLANEFFDALPIEQWQATAEGWQERRVMWDDAQRRFVFCLAPPLTAAAQAALVCELGPAFAAPTVGDIAERSPLSCALATQWAARCARQGGAALVIDYGYGDSAVGDSLQALLAHAPCDPLSHLGRADLTAHVDFARLSAAAVAGGAACWPVTPQGRFLASLGAEARARYLMKAASDERSITIGRGVHRLLHPSEMGTLFKVVAFGHPDLPPPPGFEGRTPR